jgi:mannose-6-phosphate isomerase-like protein (cupin superfamily)
MLNTNSSHGSVGAPTVHDANRLALRLDVAMARAEALTIPPSAWQTHFNTGYHNGGWQAIAMRESSAAALNIAPGDHALDTYHDNETLAACPAIAQLIAQIPCPLKSVRLMRLASGGIILEHVDAGVSLASGEVRLHIVLDTDEHTYFYVKQKRIPMRCGECWYVDVSQPHRVANTGSRDRIHLVIDCVVSPWLIDAISSSDQGEPFPDQDDPQAAFELFKETVFSNHGLQERLLKKVDRTAFVAESIAAGREFGFIFTDAEVLSAMNAGRRAWIEQWIL